MTRRFTVGVDFGTESARAVVVDVATGAELGTGVFVYRNGVIDERLPEPDADVELEPEWALQDPRDYLLALEHAVPDALAAAGVDADEVIGIGTDFTSCTMLPTTADGTPLCLIEDLRREPHAWVKLWKHHAAQPEADLVNAVAAARGEPWLARYGGKISSEWFIPKSLQILREAPHVYARAERLIEAADWIVWQLTGVETRNTCTAGYKAIWSKRDGFPSRDYFAALDPRFADVIDTRMSRVLAPLGGRAGGLSARAARLTGLNPGTPVAVANVDAHVSSPAARAIEPGTMLMIMGTSTCDILVGTHAAEVPGMCGVVDGGVVPGLFGFEAGQSGVGDIFGWFTAQCVPPAYHERAAAEGRTLHELLTDEAELLEPGASGLIALDWWNGNRSVLVDADLTGLIVGMTLATRPPEIYRALIEATAYGARTIVESFDAAGVPVTDLVACGGLPARNPFLMQVYADVLGREIAIAASAQTPALGAAIFAAVAAGPEAGGHATIEQASAAMGGRSDTVYVPDPHAHAVYDELYRAYVRLHDLFGRGGDDAMRDLLRISRAVRGRRALRPKPVVRSAAR